MYEQKEIILVEGIEAKPLFETREAYKDFRKRYEAAMSPILEEQAIRRARSEHESMFKYVL